MSWFGYIVAGLILSFVCLAGISAIFLYWITCNDSYSEDYLPEYTSIEENHNEMDNSSN